MRVRLGGGPAEILSWAPDALQFVILLCGVVGLLVVAFSIGVNRSKDLTIKTQSELITTYEQREEMLNRQMQEMAAEHDRQMKELRRDNERRIAELSGRLDAIQSTWAQGLVDQIATAVADAVGTEIRAERIEVAKQLREERGRD